MTCQACKDAATKLREAACDVDEWGGYASEYFQNKHDLRGCVQRYKDAAAAIEQSCRHSDEDAAKLKELSGNLAGIQFSANGYCPACGGWEVEKGRGCKPKVHTKTCWIANTIDATTRRSRNE